MSFLRMVLLVSAAVLAACDSPTGSGSTSRLSRGNAVEGELDTHEKADILALAVPDSAFRLLLQARSGSADDVLVAEVLDRRDSVVTSVTSVGTDTALTAQASEWVTPVKGASLRVRVRSRKGMGGGAYTVGLFVRDARPETVPAVITLGQTVEGERLEVVGDVDEFRLAGRAGQEWVVFAQGAGAELQLVDSATAQVVRALTVHAASSELEEWSTGRVVLPRTGTYLVRVTTAAFGSSASSYRLRVDAVNRAPESGTASLALGAVAGDALEGVGDIDEYTFTGQAGQEMNLMVQLESGVSAGLTVELLLAEAAVANVRTSVVTASLDENGTGRIALPADGTYRVRVSGPTAGKRTSAIGRYRLELYPVDRRPEAGGPLALDAAPLTSAIDRPGDVDEFRFQGTAGQLVVLAFSGVGTTRGDLMAEVVNAQGILIAATATRDVYSAPVGYSRTVRLPSTGTYTVRVTGRTADTRNLASGAYSLEAYTVSPAPEHIPAMIQIGETASGEAIDRPGDLDVFTFMGEAGRVVNFFLGEPSPPGMVAVVRAEDSPAPSRIANTRSGPLSLDGPSTGRITLEGKRYTVSVESESASGAGTYALRIFPIDRRPEGRSATYTLGETVASEPISPAGDIDEYTFTLATSTRLAIVWDAPRDGPSRSVFGILYDANGTERWNSWVTHNSELVREITLAAGSYRLRIENPNGGGDLPSMPYRFSFTPR